MYYERTYCSYVKKYFYRKEYAYIYKIDFGKEENTRKEVLIWLIDGVIRVLERITADF